MSVICDSYCSHGGRCVMHPGHGGLHDSRYCTWTDAEALSREQADEVLRGKPDGADYLDTLQPFADALEAFLDEK
jgi:hypothetical protein